MCVLFECVRFYDIVYKKLFEKFCIFQDVSMLYLYSLYIFSNVLKISIPTNRNF